jgi:serpin B
MKKALLILCLFTLNSVANDFAVRLYGRLSETEGNLFFSPASIKTALEMTGQGARGDTQKQFFQCLEIPADKDACPAGRFQTLENSGGFFPGIGNSVTFENANAIWVDQTFPILGTFRATVTHQYSAEVCAADFIGRPDAERKQINGWVEQKTRGRIPDLLPAGSVDSMTRLLLVNAIYFKGSWLHAFDPKNTSDQPFRTAAGGSVEVPMMRLNKTRLSYGETDGVQTLELPYQGDAVSMLLILPEADQPAMAVEAALALERRKTDVNVFLPRFKIESGFGSLKRDLAALGLTDAFDARLADFSGISAQPLYISDVVHKAFVEVNEEGTEAAAATGVMMRATSIGAPPKTFRADRPFVFLIRENESGNILFMGRVADPSGF